MERRSGKIKIVVDKFVCDGAELVINTLKPGKLPLEFDIESLTDDEDWDESTAALRCQAD